MILISIIIILGIGIFLYAKACKPEVEKPEEPIQNSGSTFSNANSMKIALSLEDKISDNTAWCGTFNLIWNDLKNDLAKQDIIFTPQPEVAQNLNKGTFNTTYLSEDSYYKVYGKPSLELKSEIEKAIQEKFNETSDILDDFDWTPSEGRDYFLYCMLKKNFEFPKIFTEMEKGKFGQFENVSYFGIDESSDEQVRKQVEVLYYASEKDFAIKLLTQGKDEVILARGTKGETFGKIYEEMKQKSEQYEGSFSFNEGDILQIPNMNIDLKEEVKEVENQSFYFADGTEYVIDKALQTIQFELDKKGGKIKSEAGMMIKEAAALIPEEPRKFILEDTFTIFLVEQGKELPYFGAKIADISQVQKEAKKVDNAQTQEPSEKSYFYGTVVESDKSYILVEPREGQEIRNSCDKIRVRLEENLDYLYEVGTNVKITFNGVILTTDPAQVEAIDIEIKSAENFELRFEDKSYESTQKVRTILDKTENKRQDYAIYSYLGEVTILIDDEEMSLRDALLENKITMEEMIAKANQDVADQKITGDMYNDGGSMIYSYENYTILKVHNLEGNRDVYIGGKDMRWNDLEV